MPVERVTYERHITMSGNGVEIRIQSSATEVVSIPVQRTSLYERGAWSLLCSQTGAQVMQEICSGTHATYAMGAGAGPTVAWVVDRWRRWRR